MKSLAKYLLFKFFQIKAILRWYLRKQGKSHPLPGDLVVSLTSYDARFDSLPMTLRCLMTQTVQPTKVLLWVAEKEVGSVTSEIKKFEQFGLDIDVCDDLKSYKKIIPTLVNYPKSFIVTADDDLYYHSRWLEELINEYSSSSPEVICHRAREVKQYNEKSLMPYKEWPELQGPTLSGDRIFPTSGGGALYPPGCFHPDVVKTELFTELSPDADDLWLYWMHRMNGVNARKVGKSRRLISWPGTQNESLKETNLYAGGNDRQIKNLMEYYGHPNS